jgi:fido (protein-threonine AMPylation protein)
MPNTFDRIAILQNQFNSLLPLSEKDQRRLDEKFRLEFSYNSNHLEGNTLTYSETKALLLKDIAPIGEIHTMRELEEMKAHDVGFLLIKEWATDNRRELTAVDIKQLNKIILVKDYWKDAQTADGNPSRKNIKVGEYKNTPNSVKLANGEIFHYADPMEVSAKMTDLFDWYHSEKDSLHPITLASVFHHKFVLIHPFDDGNGRISRLMVNYILLRNELPPIVIKSGEKLKYLNALRLADAGNMEPFIDFVAVQVKWSLEISIKAAKGESIDEIGDLDKKLANMKKEKLQGLPVLNKYDIETIDELMINDLKIFFSKLESLFVKFDEFYNERAIVLLFYGNSEPITLDSVSQVVDCYHDLSHNIYNHRIPITGLTLFSKYNKAIDKKIPNAIKSQFLSIIFHNNRIEIKLDKLYYYYLNYGEKMPEEKMDEIAELIGNDLFHKMNENL